MFHPPEPPSSSSAFLMTDVGCVTGWRIKNRCHWSHLSQSGIGFAYLRDPVKSFVITLVVPGDPAESGSGATVLGDDRGGGWDLVAPGSRPPADHAREPERFWRSRRGTGGRPGESTARAESRRRVGMVSALTGMYKNL